MQNASRVRRSGQAIKYLLLLITALIIFGVISTLVIIRPMPSDAADGTLRQVITMERELAEVNAKLNSLLNRLRDPATNYGTNLQPYGKYKLHLFVFTYKRLAGLTRLLNSLKATEYFGHSIPLTIYVDATKEKKERERLEREAQRRNISSTYVIEEDDGTRKYLDNFQWPHGPLTIHRRIVNAGLRTSIMEAWHPTEIGNEAGAFFEDDIEVSPYWYSWSLAAMRKYAEGDASQPHERLLGIALFRQVWDELSQKKCSVDNHFKAFGLQQPCSWGAIYFPKPWRRFKKFYEASIKTGEKPSVGIVSPHKKAPRSDTWDHKSSWKIYLIKAMVLNGWWMLYPNFPDSTVLATNHLMAGEHATPSKKWFELDVVSDTTFSRGYQTTHNDLYNKLPFADKVDNPNSPFISIAMSQALKESQHITLLQEFMLDKTLPHHSDLSDTEMYDVMYRKVGSVKELIGGDIPFGCLGDGNNETPCPFQGQ